MFLKVVINRNVALTQLPLKKLEAYILSLFLFQAIHELEKKRMESRLTDIDKRERWHNMRFERKKRDLNEDIKRHLAYKLVADKRRFRPPHKECEEREMSVRHKNKVLNTNYSLTAMRPEIVDMLQKIDPVAIRQDQAAHSVCIAKKKQQQLICRNLEWMAPARQSQRKSSVRKKPVIYL